jgi:hypothetical protein
MKPEMVVFFSDKDIYAELVRFGDKLATLGTDKSVILNRSLGEIHDAIQKIMASILSDAELWDASCQFNIKNIGKHFLSHMRNLSMQYDGTETQLADMFIILFRFAKELEFNLPLDKSLSPDLSSVLNFLYNKTETLSPNLQSQLTYAALEMPASIVKDRLSHPNLKSVEQFDEILAKAEALKSQWDDELKIREEKLKRIQKILEDQKTASHFVALDQGFSNLERDKKISSRWAFFLLWAIALVILGVLGVEIYIVFGAVKNNFDVIKNGQVVTNLINLNDYAYLILPTLAIEVILIYFFRVVLSNYHSLKAQILQIELRRSLCQFIQSYADYAKEINDKSAGTLERFEQIIFSGIVSDPDKVTTFDGVESLANLVKAIRG